MDRSRTPKPSHDITVYVVDDDNDVLSSLRFLLETEGFGVFTFRSAAEVLNVTAATPADCFVIDYKMPRMDGIELAGHLRNRGRAPVILITGDPDETITTRAADAGIRHVLRKPHVAEGLAALIAGTVAAG